MPDYPFLFLFFTITRPRLPEDVKLRHQICYLRLVNSQELHENTRCCITRILASLKLVGRKKREVGALA